jgi:hypothetical protein
VLIPLTYNFTNQGTTATTQPKEYYFDVLTNPNSNEARISGLTLPRGTVTVYQSSFRTGQWTIEEYTTPSDRTGAFATDIELGEGLNIIWLRTQTTKEAVDSEHVYHHNHIAHNASNYMIVLRAKGEAVQGTWPQLVVQVNRMNVTTFNVNSGEFRNYSISVTFSTIYQIDLVFTNAHAHTHSGIGALKLYIDALSIDGRAINMTGDDVVFDPGDGDAAFDEEDIKTINTGMPFETNGAIRFRRVSL